MLVDDKQAREKMARVCDEYALTIAPIRGRQLAELIRQTDLSDCKVEVAAPSGSPPIDKLMVAQGLQDAMFAHPQSGPISVQVGFVELAIEALRTPDTRDSVNAHEHTFCPHCNPCRRAPEITALEDALRSLASYVGNGGYNAPTVDAAEFEAKIRQGIESLSAQVAELRAVVAELQAANDAWQNATNIAVEENIAFQAQVAELKKDAERYRFIRAAPESDVLVCQDLPAGYNGSLYMSLDLAWLAKKWEKYTMTDTPLTDAFQNSCITPSVCRERKRQGEKLSLTDNEFFISLEHARQLERENAALKVELDIWKHRAHRAGFEEDLISTSI